MPEYSYPSTNTELIRDLKLIKHNEGGYFAETDRQEKQIPSPYADGQPRSLATTIFYLLTHDNPSGVFHMNKSATMHVLHQGRATYTLITPTNPPKIEYVTIGTDIAAGEQRQLLVGTGVWKRSEIPKADLDHASVNKQEEKTGCLITEVVFPGFHWEDHKFLTLPALEALFEGVPGGEEKVKEFIPFVKTE